MSAFADLVAEMDRALMEDLGGELVTYVTRDGATVLVTGLFEALYELAPGDPERGVSVRKPAVFLRLEDLPTDPELDDPRLTIGEVTYRRLEVKPDGAGGVLIVLAKDG